MLLVPALTIRKQDDKSVSASFETLLILSQGVSRKRKQACQSAMKQSIAKCAAQ
jgi:hypothetical protein